MASARCWRRVATHHASGSAQPHVAAATARHSAWCQVTPRPTLVCGLRRRAGGAAQRRPPLRWPRRQGGHRRAGRGTPHGVVGLAQPGNIFRARAVRVSVARGWQDAGVRGRVGDDARVCARVWCVFGSRWRVLLIRSGQPVFVTACQIKSRKNRMFGSTCDLQAWNVMKPTQNFVPHAWCSQQKPR